MNIIGEGSALTAFGAALATVEGVAKSEEADLGRYVIRYANLNAVHAEVVRACELHKLAVCQEPTLHEGMFAMRNTLIHQDGSRLEFDPMCLPMPKDAQALGSATTYLRRYSLTAQFGIAVEDDDGRAATVAAQTAPGRRSDAERMIRESMAQMDPDVRKFFIADFQHTFHSSLADLPVSKHGEALTWAREWEYVPPKPDDAVADQVGLGV